VDDIKSQLDNLSELSDEQLSEAEASIVSKFDEFDAADALTPQTVDAMTELADMLDTLRSEVARREAQAEELSARAQELSARVKGSDTPAEASADDAESPEDDATEADAPVQASAEPEVAEASASTETNETASTETEAATEEAAVEAPAEAEASEEAAPEAEAAVEEVAPEAAPEAETEAAVEEVEATPTTESEASVEESDASEASAEDVAEASAEAPVEAEASIETPSESPEAQEEAQTVTASADGAIEVPADRRPLAEAETATVAITAGADLGSVSAGQPIKSMNQVADLMSQRIHALRRVNGGDGEQVTVASLSMPYSEDRFLHGTPEENWAKVTEAKESGALVASGGFGTPVETRYDIFGFGTDARPVKDSLPKFQADRGGVRYVVPPVLSSYTGAVGVWTNQNDIDAASNSTPRKNSLTVAGATEAIALTDAVTLQLQFGNLLSRAYPELVARHNELALIQHARQAELNLLSKINAASTAVTTSSIIGFARDFLVNVRRASAAYRSRHRIDPATQLQAIAPMWVLDAMAADLALNMPGDDNLSVAKAEVSGWLSALNVSITWSYDQNTFGAQSTGALLEFPDSFTWFLFSEGSFLFLDGGTLDIGIVRDSGLVSTNDYKMFVETFEGLAFVGIESLAITSTISVNGSAAALRDTTGGATAAAIEY